MYLSYYLLASVFLCPGIVVHLYLSLDINFQWDPCRWKVVLLFDVLAFTETAVVVDWGNLGQQIANPPAVGGSGRRDDQSIAIGDGKVHVNSSALDHRDVGGQVL